MKAIGPFTKTKAEKTAPRILALILLLACVPAMPGCTYMKTQSPGARISYEEKVGRQFSIEASTYFRWIDEPEVLDFVKDIGNRISAHVVGTPYEYRFFVIRDPTMNAFAVPGGYICFFAGLLAQVDNIDGLAGVMAHEISHVEGNHFIRGQQKMEVANVATLAATILAAALGGGQGAAAGATLASAAQQTASLHYSREFEREADRQGIKLVQAAGFDPEGMLSVFKRFHALARLNAADIPPYFYTHPLPAERIYEVEGWVRGLPRDSRPRAGLETKFELARITARLRTERFDALSAWQKARVDERPDSAREKFLLGYLYLKRGDLPLALEYLRKAFAMDRSVVEHALYLARACHLSGNLMEAKKLLELASEMEPQNHLVEVYYGDLMSATEGWLEALHHYQRAAILNPSSCIAHASLAKAYESLQERGKSYYELALSDKCAGRYLKAVYYFQKALKHLDKDSAEARQVREELEWMGVEEE
jgi:predicted Zn-dependent protease